MARLVLALLGPFHATLDGQPVDGLAYDKVRALLAYLRMHIDQLHHRDALATLLWPDQHTEGARANLRKALATLRQAIADDVAQPPFLLVARDTIQFNPASDSSLDVATFDELLLAVAAHEHPMGAACTECVARLEQAVALYRGEFLATVQVRDSVPFAEWVTRMRERLHQHVLDTLRTLGAAYEQRRQLEAARQAAWQQLTLESWDEDAHRRLMRVLAQMGQRNAALQQYERCRQILADELGVEPEAETIALYERIRAGPLDLDREVGARGPAEQEAVDHAAIDAAGALTSQTGISTTAPTSPDPAPASEFAAVQVDTSEQAALSPIAAGIGLEQRNRSRMLEKVYKFWVKDVLDASLHGTALLVLGLEERPAAVAYPWDMIMQAGERPPQPFAPGTTITMVFDELGGEMLILGAAGAGKTTLLLELARELIDRAERDDYHPIPVVFNLASWSSRRRPLTDWLVDELSARYDIPRKIGHAWVGADQILPLLDGLDEVKTEHRTACVEAINIFRQEYGLLNLVICSRISDYEALATPLKLQGAVLIQPLTPEQIDTYLAHAGRPLAVLRAVLAEDTTLRELAESPLLLNIMTLAYVDSIATALPTHGTVDERRTHLFSEYIERMFARRGVEMRYSQAQTISWLAWLARMMSRQAQAIFFIERMQPRQILTRGQQRSYAIGVGLLLGLIFGLASGLGIGLLSGLVVEGIFGLIAGVGNGVTAGVIVGLLFGLAVNKKETLGGSLPQPRYPLRHALYRGGAIGLVVGISGGLVAWPASTWLGGYVGRLMVWFWLSGGLFSGMLNGLVFGLIIGLVAHPGRIEIVETLSWSWAKAKTAWKAGLLFGIGGGVAIGLSQGLAARLLGLGLSGQFVAGLASALAIALATILTLVVANGLTSGEIETKTVPNQGIQRSARNVLRVGGLVGLCVGLEAALIYAMVQHLFGQSYGMLADLAFGLSYGLPFGLAVGLLYGGLACVQHVVLRYILYRDGAIPWTYAHFLDYCAERIFLHKVGGGYIFVHRLLLEYFASLEHGAKVRSKT